MATDQQAAQAFRRLRPYLAPVMDEWELTALDGGFEAGEPYFALSYAVASIPSYQVDVPRDVLVQAFSCLNEDDRQEYADILKGARA